MNWRRYFTSSIIERGKQYHRAGLVNELKKAGNKFTAVVYGSKRYRVTITMKNGNISSMGCNCPYAMERKACKHMAAVCMEIDEFFYDEIEDNQFSFEKQIDPEVKPFMVKNTVDSKIYTYFDLSVITEKFAIKESMLKQAKELVTNKEVVLKNVRISREYTYKNGYELGGTLFAFYVKDGVQVPITVRFTAEEITQVSCGVSNCEHNHYGHNEFRYFVRGVLE